MSADMFVTHDVPGPQWQVGSLPSRLGAFALIGWNLDDVEGGVPERVVEVLSRSLAEFGRVTFACSTISAPDTPAWQMQGNDFVRRCRTRSFLGRFVAQLFSRVPVDVTLLSTTDERTVRRLFDDAGYPWWAQGQFALLSSKGASPPDFGRIAFDPTKLFDREWPESFRSLQPLGIQAILRPGVDGDVAGLLCASNEVLDGFETTLSRFAHDLGMSLIHVGETEFIEALAWPVPTNSGPS